MLTDKDEGEKSVSRNTRPNNETCSFHRLRHKSDIQKAHLNHLNLCFHDLSKQMCTENKSNSRLGEWAGPDTTCPSGECPVCLFDGLFHEFFVLNGNWRWYGEGESHQKVAVLRSPLWSRLEPALSSSRCSVSETSHHLLTSPRRSEENRDIVIITNDNPRTICHISLRTRETR